MGDDLKDSSAMFTPASGRAASISSAAAWQNGFGESSEINIMCHTLQKKQKDETNSFQHRSEEQRPVCKPGWTERRVLIITTGSLQDVALQSHP